MSSLQPVLSSSPRPAHKGLLRDDLLVLRHIFNLDLGRPAFHFPNCSEPAILGQNLPDSTIKDLLIVAIDVENSDTTKFANDGQHQVGLSILDTRHLHSFISDPSAEYDIDNLLENHQFCIGSVKYYLRISRTYCFGKSRHIDLIDLNQEIQQMVSWRDVILVVHGGSEDIRFLEAAGMDLHPPYVQTRKKQLNIRSTLITVGQWRRCSCS